MSARLPSPATASVVFDVRPLPTLGHPTARSILVVAAFPRARQMYVEALERAGHVVEGLGDGQTAIQALRTRRYDVIVCDYQMEGVTGLDVLEAARRHVRSTAIILISAMATDAVVAHAYACGAFAVLAKPLSVPGLLRAVDDALGAVRGLA
jgi:CheY-like chemotaxis protein